MLNRPIALLLFLALLVCGSSSCSSVREPDPSWVEGEVEAVSRNVLWQMTQLSMQRRGFPTSGGADIDALIIESGWRNRLAPFRGDGRRHQAVVKLSHQAGRTWKVEVRVRQMANMSIVKPTDPTYAEWKWRDDDEEEALILLQMIRSSLTTPGESPSFVGSAPADPR